MFPKHELSLAKFTIACTRCCKITEIEVLLIESDFEQASANHNGEREAVKKLSMKDRDD